MYIPLYGKSYVSKKGVILQDKKAEAIWEKEAFELNRKGKSKWLAYFMAMRGKVFDNWVKTQLENTENPVVLHIGCGMDSRCERIDADCQWYDLDYPDVIRERRKYYTETENYHMISSNVLEFGWISSIPSGNAIVIFEGVSMYIGESQLQNLLKELNRHFLSVAILMDCYTESAAKFSKYKNPIGGVGVKYWSVHGYSHPKVFEKGTELTFVQEYNMTPGFLVNQLPGLEKFIFKHLFAGKIAKSLYRIYEYKSKKGTTNY